MSETVVTVRLTPNASRNDIQGWSEDPDGAPVLKVRVTAVPEKGKANDALIALLSKAWRIPASSITIAKGATDRMKTLRIAADISVFIPEERGEPSR